MLQHRRQEHMPSGEGIQAGADRRLPCIKVLPKQLNGLGGALLRSVGQHAWRSGGHANGRETARAGVSTQGQLLDTRCFVRVRRLSRVERRPLLPIGAGRQQAGLWLLLQHPSSAAAVPVFKTPADQNLLGCQRAQLSFSCRSYHFINEFVSESHDYRHQAHASLPLMHCRCHLPSRHVLRNLPAVSRSQTFNRGVATRCMTVSASGSTDGQPKVALITGGNTGIGFETARALAKKGFYVVIACRDNDKALAAQAKIKCGSALSV